MQKWQGKPLVELLFLLEMLRAQKPEVLRRGISITFLHLFLTTQSQPVFKKHFFAQKKKKKIVRARQNSAVMHSGKLHAQSVCQNELFSPTFQ